MASSSHDLQGVLLGIGNPLLDISAHVPQQFLDKYELKTANAILADPVKHLPLYEELVKNHKVDYTAGGATQNSIRAAQWMLQIPGATTFIGCIGNDENGKNMKIAAEQDGLKTLYMIDEKKPTGTCAVLIKDKERSLVANLGAAESYKKEHFENEATQLIVKKARYFYSSGFFLTVSPDTLIAIGKHAKETNKHFAMNLSAPFLIDFFWNQMSSVLPYADVVFCNDDEAKTLGKKMEWGSDLVEIAKKLADFPKENASRKRTVIFTQGSKQTIVCLDNKITMFHPIACKPEEIVDTNGAGDSFVGGFLSQYVQQKPIEVCIDAGHYCACECIKRSGATYPPKPNFVLKQ